MSGERWNMIFDIVPQNGNHIIMDGMPGLIHSGDDFGVNSAGIMITETTISRFAGWDPNGIAEFVRARKAMQYANSIDDFARIMKEGNNGGYANDWLVADNKTGEVASLELGLKNVTLDRTKDGYFVGSNFTINEKLAKEETEWDPERHQLSANARHIRWTELMRENKGKIDVQGWRTASWRIITTRIRRKWIRTSARCAATSISRRVVCSRGSRRTASPARRSRRSTDAALAGHMSLTAALGHACGINFKAAEHLRKHPEFALAKGLPA